jgi:hypothetical protein
MTTTLASKHAAPLVDSTDWLKAAAIVLVAIDHTGYFFIENDLWWRVFGRLAAPAFFFLLGYAKSRDVPAYWIWLGVFLTVLDSSNNGWSWAPPNILLSFALIRLARPHVERLLQQYTWLAFAALSSVLVAALPYTAQLVEYGTSGWLWALFGISQRMYLEAQKHQFSLGYPHLFADGPTGLAAVRLAASIIAAMSYLWQDRLDFALSQAHFGVLFVCICVLSALLLVYRRGPSPIQPPAPCAPALRFVGRHTLVIYALQLAGSEFAIKLFPQIAS